MRSTISVSDTRRFRSVRGYYDQSGFPQTLFAKFFQKVSRSSPRAPPTQSKQSPIVINFHNYLDFLSVFWPVFGVFRRSQNSGRRPWSEGRIPELCLTGVGFVLVLPLRRRPSSRSSSPLPARFAVSNPFIDAFFASLSIG